MAPWSFWTSRANSDPLPVKSRQDSRAKSPLVEDPETSRPADDKVYATSAPGAWDQHPESLPVSQPHIIQPDQFPYQSFGRPLVLNRMDSPLQEPDDNVSSVIRGAHEDEVRELVAVIKELREQAARDAELISELRGQAEDNAHAIGGLRIEHERLVKELSATASEARAAAAAAAASASEARAAAIAAAATAAQSPPVHRPPALAKRDEEQRAPKQVPPLSTPSSPKVSPATPLFIPKATNPNPPPNPPPYHSQATPSSPYLAIFEIYDRMINELKTKPPLYIQLGDYPWPMLPDPAGSFPKRITMRSDVKKEKVYAFVQAYASISESGRRKERGEAMLKAWKSIMDRSEDIILNGTAARAFTYMDMAARSL
jgi:hypothetical protein